MPEITGKKFWEKAIFREKMWVCALTAGLGISYTIFLQGFALKGGCPDA